MHEPRALLYMAAVPFAPLHSSSYGPHPTSYSTLIRSHLYQRAAEPAGISQDGGGLGGRQRLQHPGGRQAKGRAYDVQGPRRKSSLRHRDEGLCKHMFFLVITFKKKC